MKNISIERNDCFLKVAQGVIRLHELYAKGMLDSDEADFIRDDLDDYYFKLTKEESELLRWLSADLYDLTDIGIDRNVKERNPQVNKSVEEIFRLKRTGRYDEALSLVRRWKDYFSYKDLCYIRGSIWFARDFPTIAEPFFREASRIDPDLNVLYLNLLDKVDKNSAINLSKSILESANESHAFSVLSAVAHVAEAIKKDGLVWKNGFSTLLDILSAIPRFIGINLSAQLRSNAMAMLALQKSLCYRGLGNEDSAVKVLTEAINEDPSNLALLVSRGQLLATIKKDSPLPENALSDFGLACAMDAPFVEPYFYLAHDRFVKNDFLGCEFYCKRGLKVKGSKRFRSKLYEMMAVAQSHLKYNSQEVIDAFNRSIAEDPSNPSASSNKMIYERMLTQQDECNPSFEVGSVGLFSSTQPLDNEIYEAFNSDFVESNFYAA